MAEKIAGHANGAKPYTGKLIPRLLSITGLVLAAAASFVQGWALRSFYFETANMPRGTGIRPMGLVGMLFVLWAGTFFAGGFFSCAGLIFSIRCKCWHLVPVAILGLILSLALPFWGNGIYDYIVAVRGLVNEP